VLLVPVHAVPAGAKPVKRDAGRVVLAYGEVHRPRPRDPLEQRHAARRWRGAEALERVAAALRDKGGETILKTARDRHAIRID
jgi:hypothetical protein